MLVKTTKLDIPSVSLQQGAPSSSQFRLGILAILSWYPGIIVIALKRILSRGLTYACVGLIPSKLTLEG